MRGPGARGRQWARRGNPGSRNFPTRVPTDDRIQVHRPPTSDFEVDAVRPFSQDPRTDTARRTRPDSPSTRRLSPQALRIANWSDCQGIRLLLFQPPRPETSSRVSNYGPAHP